MLQDPNKCKSARQPLLPPLWSEAEWFGAQAKAMIEPLVFGRGWSKNPSPPLESSSGSLYTNVRQESVRARFKHVPFRASLFFGDNTISDGIITDIYAYTLLTLKAKHTDSNCRCVGYVSWIRWWWAAWGNFGIRSHVQRKKWLRRLRAWHTTKIPLGRSSTLPSNSFQHRKFWRLLP